MKNLDWPERDAPTQARLLPLWQRAKENWAGCVRRAAAHLATGQLVTAGEWLTLAANIERDWYPSSDLTRDVTAELCRRSGTVL